MDIIVDGYNLMHAAGLAKSSYGPRGLQKARHLLVLRVKLGFQEAELPHLLMVFDAKEAPAETAEELLDQGVRIRFALPGTEADDLIEELILRHSAPRQLLVVSSDHRLQRAARRRNASFIDSDLFLDDLERKQQQAKLDKRRQTQQAQQKNATDPQVSLEEWLLEFGDINVHELSHQIESETFKTEDRSPSPIEQNKPVSTTPSGAAGMENKHLPKKVQRRGTPAADHHQRETEPPLSSMPDELKFWQDRIDEFFDKEGG